MNQTRSDPRRFRDLISMLEWFESGSAAAVVVNDNHQQQTTPITSNNTTNDHQISGYETIIESRDQKQQQTIGSERDHRRRHGSESAPCRHGFERARRRRRRRGSERARLLGSERAHRRHHRGYERARPFEGGRRRCVTMEMRELVTVEEVGGEGIRVFGVGGLSWRVYIVGAGRVGFFIFKKNRTHSCWGF